MIGKTIAHYRIMATLGSGGMSIVYKAQDTRLGRFVALKFLLDRFCRNPRTLKQFQQEARTASALNHPAICTIHDIGLYGERPFIVMEYLEGETLRDKIRRHPITMQEAIVCGINIADALSEAHAAGIVHRDISPANIFLTLDGRVKLLDFGVATVIERNGRTARRKNATGPRTLTGTVHYMSPEQARATDVDTRSDIFSFGLVLYELLSGKRAFTGSNVSAVINQILHARPQPLRKIAPNVPEALETIVHNCLEKDPARRFQTAAELRDAFRGTISNGSFDIEATFGGRYDSTTDQTQCIDLFETIPDTTAER
jgi:serine/threonine protein kinase